MQKVPYQLILGDKEMQAKTVTARLPDGKGGGENLAPMSIQEFVSRVMDEVAAKH